MALYGVDLHCRAKQIVLDIQLKCKVLGPLSLRRMEHHFKLFDPDDTAAIQLSEFHEALNAVGLFLPIPELQALHKNFQDQHQKLRYGDVLQALRPQLSERCASLVAKAYEGIANGGPVTLNNCADAFLAANSPQVAEGRTEAEARDEFRNLLGAHCGVDAEGTVELPYFLAFHADLRLCLPSDDYLVDFVQKSWGNSESGRPPTGKQVEEIILTLRTALLSRTVGSKDEVKMREFLRQYLPAASEGLELVGPEELFEMMLHLGVRGTPALAAGVIARVDEAGQGKIPLARLVNTVCSVDPRWRE